MADWPFKLSIAILAIILSASCATSQEPAPRRCVSALEVEASRALSELKDKAAARSGLAHIVFPSEAEIAAMNRSAILGVQVYAQKQDDLPLTEVYVASSDDRARLYSLPRIFPRPQLEAASDETQATRLLGKFRQTVYLFLPLRLLARPGEIAVTFAGQSEGTVLIKLPLKNVPAHVAEGAKAPEDPNVAPDPKITLGLLKTHYCVQ